MRAGRLRHRVVIEKNAPTADGSGALVDAWTTFATRWASVEPLSGREFFASRQIEAEVTTRIRLRHLAGVTPKMRVLVPRAATVLDGAINDSVTSITVDSAAGFPDVQDYLVKVGGELMRVTGGHGTTSWTVARGANGTSAASHADDAAVEHLVVHDVHSVINENERDRELHLMCTEVDEWQG